jgi:arylsulfatase
MLVSGGHDAESRLGSMIHFSCASRLVAILSLLVLAFGLSSCTPEQEGREQPNILLVMADDIGFSDLGSFGAVHVKTPHLDSLARGGVRFTEFYNMAKCDPSRASLLSGMTTEKEHSGNGQPLSKLLSDVGYYTAMAGKEHFSTWYGEQLYHKQAYDDAFTYWAINPYFIPPEGTTTERNEDSTFTNPFRINKAETDYTELNQNREPFYKTDIVTNYGLQFLDNASEEDGPFFLYMPYHVPHYPLQARAEDIEKYEGVFSEGWDQLRKDRFQRQKEIGIMPEGTRLSESEDNIYPHGGSEDWWQYDPRSSASAKEKENYAREMAVYAAMIDRLDQNVGRLLEKLRAMGEAENTMIVFLSDNGACPFDNGGYTGHGDPSFGAPGSYGYQRPEWAGAANTPYRYFKQYGHEGGSHTPFFAYWPGEIDSGTISEQIGHVTDLLPTFLNVAGTSYPEEVNDQPAPVLDGQSLLPVLQGQKAGPEEDRLVISGFGSDKRMLRAGDWKIVRVKERPWELYNLKEDPAETNNLAEGRPEKVKALEQRFQEWKSIHGASFERSGAGRPDDY